MHHDIDFWFGSRGMVHKGFDPCWKHLLRCLNVLSLLLDLVQG